MLAVTATLGTLAVIGSRLGSAALWTLAIISGFVTVELACSAFTRRREADTLDEAISALRGAATRDALTGTANRVGVLDELRRRMLAATSGPVGVLTVDLDRLASVNQMLGHDRGDTLLVEIADRIVAT